MPDTAFAIRAGRRADAPACAAIERRCEQMFAATAHAEIVAPAPAPPDAIADAAEIGRLVVAVAGGAVAGYAIYEIEADSLHVCEIDVDPPHQRRGLARALIAEIAARARRLDRDALTLTTYDDVPWNAPAYARMGFETLAAADWTPECRNDNRWMTRAGQDVSRRVAMILWL